MRQINPAGFAYKEAAIRANKQKYAQAIRRKKQKEIDAWATETHTVMELVGGEPTGLIKNMLGSSILSQNSDFVMIHLQEMSNWDAFGGKLKPMLRELVTPNKFRNLVYNEKKKQKTK